MICKINGTTEKLNSSNSNIFFTAYTDPDIQIELVYMIVPWLVVLIFASMFLEMFANVEFRNSLWSKLGLDALGLKPNGNKFLWICKNGYDNSKWDLVGYSSSPGFENAVKRWGRPIGPIWFSVYFDASL